MNHYPTGKELLEENFLQENLIAKHEGELLWVSIEKRGKYRTYVTNGTSVLLVEPGVP